jgi:hypothetical protein
MIRKLLCWLGFHSWRLVDTYVAYAEGQHEVIRVVHKCKHCPAMDEYYDTGE